MSLRRRLLAFALALIVIPAAVAIAGYVVMASMAVPAMRAAVAQRAELQLQQLEVSAVAPLASEEPAAAVALIASLTTDPHLRWAVVRDASGAVRAQHGSPPAGPGPRGRVVATTGDLVTAWTSIDVEGLALGQIGLGYALTDAARVRAWTTVLELSALVIAAVAVVFAITFTRAFMRPIDRMKRFAAAVTAGDLAHRTGSREAHELGELARYLDTMTDALELRDGELARRQVALEGALASVRKTQDELMHSSRLAAIGEMAGRTAHEVLNPAQSIHGRLCRMAGADLEVAAHNAELLEVIAASWRAASDGGPAAFVATLAETLDGSTVLASDLAALTDLARAHRDAVSRTSQDVEFLLRELDRITRIVDGMRSMSRRTSSLDQFRLDALLTEAAEIVRDACDKRAISVAVGPAADLAVEVDRYEFLQVVTNLLRNAMPAIEQAHGRAGGAITIASTAELDHVHVDIRDDGVGISPEHVPLIFDQSFTTRSASEGTGLGLGISRRLVRQMGGELSLVATAIGGGTTFRITLPRAAPQRSSNQELLHDEPHAA